MIKKPLAFWIDKNKNKNIFYMSEKEKGEEKRELIFSIAIMGHGCEHLLRPWKKDMPILRYFIDNVRVYSRACVPDLESVGDVDEFKDMVSDIQHRFSEVPENETASIVSTYADDERFEYQKKIIYNLAHHKQSSLGPRFDKFNVFENIERASNLSAFISNKEFSFHINSPEEKTNTKGKKELYKTIGVHVVDIRVKKTSPSGAVTYEKLFSPSSNLSNSNLIYRNGVIFILQEVLRRPELVEPALRFLGFEGATERVMTLSLEQIYEFFQLVGISYVNLMDFTCRACSVGVMPQSISDQFYNIEQKLSVKKSAFGKRNKRTKQSRKKRINQSNKNKKQSNKKKQRDNKK